MKTRVESWLTSFVFSTTVALLVVPLPAAARPFWAGSSVAPQSARLNGARDKGKDSACRAHAASLKKRSDQLTKMATNMETKFTAIATRVEDYYIGKVVPSGQTVSGYTELVAAIGQKKTVVDQKLTMAQASAAAFNCDTPDPKGQMTTFRLEMQAIKSALHDYRTTIKDLIVAVRSLNQTNRTRPSPVSPSPTTQNRI